MEKKLMQSGLGMKILCTFFLKYSLRLPVGTNCEMPTLNEAQATFYYQKKKKKKLCSQKSRTLR
jgi:hypothetical protein